MHSVPSFYVLSIYMVCSSLLIPNCLALSARHRRTTAPSPRLCPLDSPSSSPSPQPFDSPTVNGTCITVPLSTHADSAVPPSIAIDPTISASSLLHPTVSASSKFNPPIGIIIFVMLAAFLLMGIFSMYIRRCTLNHQLRRRNVDHNFHGRPAVRRHLQSAEDAGGGPPHGLDSLLVSSLPTKKFFKAKGLDQSSQAEKGERIVVDCVVCLSEFEDGEELRCLPKCGHHFHLGCIDMWLSSHTTCPLCRRSLLREGKHNEDRNRDVHEPLSLLSLQ